MKNKIFIFVFLLALVALCSFFDIEVSKHLIKNPTPNFWFYIYKHFNIVPIFSLALVVTFYFYGLVKKNYLIQGKSILFIISFLILSQGLVHLSKAYLGRPRPREIYTFNKKSNYTYQLPFEYKNPKPAPLGQSFPSGHAGFSFFLIYLYFIFRQKKNASLFLYFSILYGCFVGLGRIIQGAHFLSDVTASFLFVYISGEILYLLFYKKT